MSRISVWPRAVVAFVVVAVSSPAAAAAALPDLLVASRLGNQVLRYTGGGSSVGVAAQGNGMMTPNGLAIAGGNLYVASRDGGQILKFNGLGDSFAGVFAQGLEMVGPSDVLFGPNGDLYVANSLADNVSRYDRATGALVATYRHPALVHPVGLAFSADGRLFASSVTARRLYELNPNTSEVIGVVAEGGLLAGPADIHFGPDGLLYAANPPGNSVTRYDPVSGQVTTFLASAQLAAPTSLQFGDDGKWYVGSFSGDRVMRLTAAGALDGAFIPTGLGGLDGPQYLLFIPEPAAGAALLAAAGMLRGRRRR